MGKMVALRSLCRSVRSVAFNRQLLRHPPRQHYSSYSTGAVARTLFNISPPTAKHLSSDDYGSWGLGSRRFSHGKSFDSATIQHLFNHIQEEMPDRLEKFAFEMHDFLMKEGLEEEAKRLFKPLFVQKKRAKVPAVAVLTLMMNTYLSSGQTDKALKVHSHMLATGVSPSTYTYTLLVASLAIAATSDSDPNLIRYAKKYFLEMLDKGMKANKVYVRVFEGIACLETKEELREFLELIKAKGFVPDPDTFDLERHDLEDAIKGMKLFHDLENTPDMEMQRIFRDWRIHGIQKQAENVFHALVAHGNHDEARELYVKQFSERCGHHMVVMYTCAMEAYINAGKTKGALEVYQHMLAAEYAPCSYTYAVLIKALAADPSFFGDAKKYFLEMMDNGMRPNAATYTAVLEGFARQEDKAAAEEGKEFVEVMMRKGIVLDAKAVRKVLRGRPEPLVTRVMDIISSM
ncbi:hypothetical protein M0R45_020744 [Rubus argutus]|uniref:Pentatricopeptide repeat-containing protein n=1 Tax=Rubus argutus TaxID=59490 RepID=A0AAW1XAU3_RUBAR